MKIIFRPLLISGMLSVADDRHTILVDNEQSKREQARALWHEVVHSLLLAAGVQHHGEDDIEAAALRLADACPEIIDVLQGRGWPKLEDPCVALCRECKADGACIRKRTTVR